MVMAHGSNDLDGLSIISHQVKKMAHVHHFDLNNFNGVKSLVDEAVKNQSIENYQVLFGNAKTKERHHIVSGKQYDGSDLTTDNYVRWMSMTKLVGALTALKAMEDGIISIYDEIKKYIPGFAANQLSVVNSTFNGTVPCEKEITIRMLLNMTAGFSYGIYLNVDAVNGDT